MGLMNQLLKLAELFAEYKLYPSECFTNSSIAHIFQSTHSNDNYSKDLYKILLKQQYRPEQRGADLPYWGNQFFKENVKSKVMVISQDSNTPDAGSVVFHACLWPYMEKEEYKNYTKTYKLKAYSGYDISKDLIQLLGLEHLYITDASKVYKKGSWKDKDFNKFQSKELLEQEIDICNPDLIVLLGKNAMELLGFKERFSEVNGRTIITRNNKPYIIATFPSRANPSYKSRAEITKMLIRQTLNRMN